MGKIAEFCRHPGDLESCKISLVKSWQEGTLEKHCIFEGLRANWHQCREVLLECLHPESKGDRNSNPKNTSPVTREDLEHAGKDVVILGFPQGIEALWDVFYEAYYRLIRSTIRRFGLKDDRIPSADDVFQQVLENLLNHFKAGASVEGRLKSYIVAAAVYECLKAIKTAWSRKTLTYEEELQEAKASVAVFLPPNVVENWEELDNVLAKSDQGDIINRIILALQCLDSCSSGKRPSAKLLKEYFEASAKYPDEKIVSLHKQTAVQVERFGSMGMVNVVADVANDHVIHAPPDVPIVFAAAAGMDVRQIRQLLGKLSSLSEGAIYTRICRIFMVLKQLKNGEQQ